MNDSLVLYLTSHVPKETNRVAYQRANESCKNFNTVFLTRRGVSPAIKEKAANVQQCGESLPMRILFPLWLVLTALQIYRENDIQHIHTNHSPQSLVAGWVLSLLGFVWIVDIYDSPHISIDLNSNNSGVINYLSTWYNRVLVAIVKRTLSSADLIIIGMAPGIVSEYGVSADDNNVLTVTNGTNVDKNRSIKSPDDRSDVFQIVYVGPIRQERGLRTMLDAMKILDKRLKASELHLVGTTGSEADKREIECLDSTLSNIDIFNHGYIEHDEALEKAAVADVGLCPLSLEVENYRYSYPIKVLEYMSVGTPTVATKTEGTSHLLREGSGILVQADNPIEMADAINELYEHPEQRNQMAKTAQLMAENYRWDSINRKVNQRIGSVME